MFLVPSFTVNLYSKVSLLNSGVIVYPSTLNSFKLLSFDLAGADVVFKVKVHEIKEKKTRELDEEFFEDLGMDGINSEEKFIHVKYLMNVI